MAKKARDSRPQQVMSEEEKLRDETARLRKALEYSELRNEALNEVLKIGKEKYGIDLLGFIGLIIALPLTSLIIAYWQRYVTKEHLNDDDPPTAVENQQK